MMEASPEANPNQYSSAEPPKGDSASSYFSKLVVVLGSIGTVWIFALMVLINTDIFGRALFNSPVPGVPEMVQMSIVAIVFLQIAHALAAGRFTRSEAIYSRLMERAPRVGHVLGVLFNLTGAALMSLILYGTIPRFVDAVAQGYYFGHRGVFTAPRWPIELIIIIGCAVTAVQFLVLTWRDLRDLRGNASLPSPN